MKRTVSVEDSVLEGGCLLIQNVEKKKVFQGFKSKNKVLNSQNLKFFIQSEHPYINHSYSIMIVLFPFIIHIGYPETKKYKKRDVLKKRRLNEAITSDNFL